MTSCGKEVPKSPISQEEEDKGTGASQGKGRQ